MPITQELLEVADWQTQSRHHRRAIRTQKQILTTMWRLEEGERGCFMTLLELERANQGWNILKEIEGILNEKIELLEEHIELLKS